MGGFSPDEQEVLRRWKSLKHIHAFLKREFNLLNRLCFESRLSLPVFRLPPMRLSRRPLENHRGAAFYRPAHRESPAEIGIFPHLLLNREETRIALAHEMAHHWEWSLPEEKEPEAVCVEVKSLLEENLQDAFQAENFQRHHSSRFLGKIQQIARSLQIPVGKFLFKL